MSVDRKAANLQKLSEAHEIQDKTKEAIWRIQKQTAEAEELGTQTLEELRKQGQQMDDINQELDSVSGKLDTSQALQSKFDRWAGNWLGGKKSKAMNEAAAEIKLRNQEDHSKVKEVFQQEKYDSISRVWKKSHLVLCTDPSMECPDLFDPAVQESIENSHWIIDFSLTGIDSEGWTYAYDFATLNKNGIGAPTPAWNSYVRRRKWRYEERNLTGGNDVGDIRSRANARKTAQGVSNQSKQGEKLGYVPRGKMPAMKESGLTSGSMMGSNGASNQDLDDESAAGMARVKATDAEIDAGINAIGDSLDRLKNISDTMNTTIKEQNVKLDKMETKMATTTEKQTVVNARQRYLLK